MIIFLVIVFNYMIFKLLKNSFWHCHKIKCVESKTMELYTSSYRYLIQFNTIQFLYCLGHYTSYSTYIHVHCIKIIKFCRKQPVSSNGSSKKNEKKPPKQNYLYTKVQLYIKLVMYIENDKSNCLNAHILELVLNKRALKIF